MKAQSITENQKTQIQHNLRQYVSTFKTQQLAAMSLDDCSEATVITILNKGKEANVSEAMWLNVGKQVGAFKRQASLVETQDFQTLVLYYSLAKEEGATFYVIGGAGHGKTFSAEAYAKANRARNVYYLKCSALWNKKTFLSNILHAMGKDSAGMNIIEMMDEIVRGLTRQAQPLIIFDEMDKLSDNVLMFFIILYNELNSLCGFVMQSTNQIVKRLKRGLSANKTGYQEFYSRIGSKFIELHGTTPAEVREICEANGITSQEEIAQLLNEHTGDLRRLDRQFLKASAKAMRSRLKATA